MQLGCSWGVIGPRVTDTSSWNWSYWAHWCNREGTQECSGWELGGTGKYWGGTGIQECPEDPGVPQKTPRNPGVPQRTQEIPRNPGMPRRTQERPKGPRSAPEDPGDPQEPRSAPEDPGDPQGTQECPRGPRSSLGTQECPRRTLASPSPPAVPEETPSPPGDPDVPKGTVSPCDVPKGTQASGGGQVWYRLRVTTGTEWGGGTLAAVTLTLVGTEGQSHPCHLRWPQQQLCPGTTLVASVTSPCPLGPLLLLRVHTEPLVSLVPDRWLLERVTVTGPLGDTGDTGDIGDIGDTGGIGDTGDNVDMGGTGDNRDTDDNDDNDGDDDGDTGDNDGDIGDTGGAGDVGDSDVPSATFPCHRWLGSGCTDLREGTARTPLVAARIPQLLRLRQEEREEREEAFQFAPYAPCWPWRLRALRPALCPWPRPPAAPSPASPVWPQLPPSLAFPIGHRVNIIARAAAAQFRFRRCGASWRSFEELHAALGKPGTPIAEYVLQHWRDDAFFGAQYLSGVNPFLLRRCHQLPPNFPVTPPMVAPSLGPHTSLQQEMEEGRLFLADYALLRGVRTRPLGGVPQSVAAAVCLLWLNPRGELRPIAIQLSQDPGVPIFTPQDAPWCWALAKLWVRGSHFALHELVTHLLTTHFLAETFAVATQRLPAAHPVHQLLLPHFRFTFHINILARESLLSPGGIIDQATAVGREGTLELVARGTAALTYRELCVPEDIEDRGVADVPNYHYRDDALEIWAAMESLVQGVVSLYYPGDKEVAEDEELQSWVGDIFTYGVLGNRESGFPSKLLTRPELVKFMTMIMFCCSARHAAVNSGQYDFAAWMPNTPGTLQGDPPVTKAEATEQRFLGTLPSPVVTGALLALLSVVSYEGGQPRPLGSRSPELLSGAAARRLIGRFRRRLAAVSRRIRDRNRRLELPYPYLDPARVTESVAI